MKKALSFIFPALLITASTVFLGGCAADRLEAERDSLYRQNQQMQQSLLASRSEREQALAERERLAAELAAAQQQLEAERSKPAPPAANLPASSRTGFEGIAGIETERNRDRIIVRVPGDVLFEPGKVALLNSSLRTLDQVVAVIKKEYPANTLRIDGYTDSDPIRKSQWKDNLELSLQRAAAVHRYLQTKGMDAKKMYAAGFGQASPRPTKAQSRRVEIVVVLGEHLVAK